MSKLTSLLYMLEVEKTLRQLANKINGGGMASRNYPRCYSKQNQKERLIEKIQSARKLSFLRKHLSLETIYTLLGISENLKNLLSVRTSGEKSTLGLNLANVFSPSFLEKIPCQPCNDEDRENICTWN